MRSMWVLEVKDEKCLIDNLFILRFWTVKAAAAKIPDGGSIINMSSVASSVKGAPNRWNI